MPINRSENFDQINKLPHIGIHNDLSNKNIMSLKANIHTYKKKHYFIFNHNYHSHFFPLMLIYINLNKLILFSFHSLISKTKSVSVSKCRYILETDYLCCS
jgi:hypothetical protein